MKRSIIISILTLAAAVCFAQAPKQLTNADIVNMVKAGLPESTLVMTIRANPSAFDTSPQGLISLKKAGVPSNVIEAMIQPKGAKRTADPAPPATSAAAPMPPALADLTRRWGSQQTRIEVDRVFLVDGENRIEMKYSQPSTRRRHIVFVFQQFAVLNGPSAKLRTANHSPEFEMILPNNVEVSSIVALAKLEPRASDVREIMISNTTGLGSTMGFPTERSMKISYAKSDDQSAAPEGYDVYHVKAERLERGEYAFVVNKPGNGMMGAFGSASLNYNFYELGVE
jgi:hypothetical protein